MMIAANARVDHGDRMETTLDDYLKLSEWRETPITIRQGIPGLMHDCPFHEKLRLKIADRLMQLDLKDIRETMRNPF
jgi:predicted metal-dependent hydrolase